MLKHSPTNRSSNFLLRDISVVKSFILNTGFLSSANGEKLLLKTSDNEKFLAEVDDQKSATAPSSSAPSAPASSAGKLAKSQDHEPEGANGDYTDSYEAEDVDEEGDDDMDDDDDDDVLITPRLKKKLEAASQITATTTKAGDYNLGVGKKTALEIVADTKRKYFTD